MARRFAHWVTVAGVMLTASPAFAAEFTDLVDAADDKDDLIDETYDGFDFTFEPRFRMDFGTAQITREGACVDDASRLVGEASQNFERSNPRLEVDPQDCPDDSAVVDRPEADYRNNTMTLEGVLKVGLYKDLQLSLAVPYVISDVHGMRYAEGLSGSNSSIDPSDERIAADAEAAFDGGDVVDDLDFFSTYRFFELGEDFRDIERSGFADPTLGLHWAPFNDERDPTKATLMIGMDYVMPIAPVKRVDNNYVGLGMHELSWIIASSKKFDFIEPYFGLEYFLPIPAPRSPIRRVDVGNNGQVFTQPPQRGEITIGTEFIPYENSDEGQRYSFDLQFRFGYTSEGRDYTPLFDHMGASDCVGKSLDEVLPSYDEDGNLVAGDVECAWIARQPSNAENFRDEPNPIYDLNTAEGNPRFDQFNGIMTVESYASFSGKAGLNLQPSEYFQLRAHVQLTHKQEHFLTNARTGRDVDNAEEVTDDDTVDLEGPDAEREKNPVFNAAYDGNGERFRVQEYNIWSVFLTAALKF